MRNSINKIFAFYLKFPLFFLLLMEIMSHSVK